MDLFASMSIFAKVVELGSFSAAARVTNISTAMVSQHIQKLESHLDTRLLNRSTRRLSLTEVGRNYYSHCADILARVANAETMAREVRVHPKGKLRISAVVSLAAHDLIPAIADYLKTYQEVNIELIFSDKVVDLIEDGFDVVFRYGTLPDSGLIARPLYTTRLIPCASPDYLKIHGTPKSAEDFSSHKCLVFHNVVARSQWRFEGDKSDVVNVDERFTTNQILGLHAAALEGVGIAMLPEVLVKPDLSAGRLVHLLPELETIDRPLHLLYLPDKQMTPKLKSFIDFICHRFQNIAK